MLLNCTTANLSACITYLCEHEKNKTLYYVKKSFTCTYKFDSVTDECDLT